jgi:TonB-linked SusC/RagA family outer membrane protein
MRLSVLQIFLICSILGNVCAKDGKAQGLLDTKLTIKKEKANIQQMLNAIQQTTDINFIYNSKLISEVYVMNIDVKDETVANILEKILKPVKLDFEITNGFVVIKRMSHDPENQSEIIVSGVVTDNKGESIPGVTVKVKDQPISVSTDLNGNFKIKVTNSNAILVFSFIGYKTQEIRIGENTNLKVVLNEVVNDLNEIVVIGYGTAKKRDLTGSVGSVNMTDLNKAPVKSFDEALAGRIAGVAVSSNDGQPGSPVSIVIRGANSLTQDNSPLYVVDGFPQENPNNNILNPAEIASIEVLKDASATAIYGARGANGVIIITTKRGQKGDPTVNYSGYYGLQSNIKTMELLSPYQFVQEQLEYDPSTTNTSSPYTLYDIANKGVDYYKNVPAIDWQNLLYRKASMQNHFLSVSGGSDKTKYAFSGSYTNQAGTIINTDYTRYQGRMSIDQDISSKLRVGINTNYSNLIQNGSAVSGYNFNSTLNLLYGVEAYRPLAVNGNTDFLNTLFDPTVNPNNDYRVNPILSQSNAYNRYITNDLTSNGYLEYTFIPGLKLRITGGVDRNSLRSENFYNSQTRQGSVVSNPSIGVNGNVIFTDFTSLVNENTITYTKQFNNHHLDVLAGYTQQKYTHTSYGFSAIQLPNESLGISGLDEGVPQTLTANGGLWTLYSYLGRINYNYKGIYFLTGTFRSDGSSKFSPANHWSYFPSGSFAWRISEYPILKRINVLSDAKFRLSYGTTGNNRVSDFPYLSVVSLPAASAYYFNNSISQSALLSTIGNPDLKWETTHQYDLGLDLALFNSKVAITIDLYRKNTNNLLLNANLPYSTGFDSGFKNIGEVRNDGLEITLNSTFIQTKKFAWNSNFNIAFNRSKVLALTQNQESLLSFAGFDQNYKNIPLYLTKVGQPISQFYGWVTDGLYQYADFDQLPNGTYVLKSTVPTNGNVRSAIKPGDIKYIDLNGDGVVDANDRTVLGRTEPVFTAGFSNNFSYKGFDLNIFFQSSYGNNIMNGNRIVFEGNAGGEKNMFASYANRWTPTNTNTTIPRVLGDGPMGYSDRTLEDGSYLRLKTVNLGYGLPNKIVQHLKIHALRVYASAQNIYTWTKYSGLDPEVSTYNSALTPGFDYSAYPRARTITFGINATF